MKKNIILRDMKNVGGAYRDEEYRDITDSVSYWDRHRDRAALDLIYKAMQLYASWDSIREEWQRCKDFTYGDQWRDLITVEDECGRSVTMTEKDYLIREGMIPLTNNLIRRLVRNITGVFRNQNKETSCRARDRKEQQFNEALSTILQRENQVNNMPLKNARACERGLMGGFACYKHTAGWKNHRYGVWVDEVSINDIAADTNAKDATGKDFRMIVQLHQMTIDEVCATWARSKEDIQKIKTEYRIKDRDRYLTDLYHEFGMRDARNSQYFFFPDDPNLCRVIEVWTKETRIMYHAHDWATGELFDVADEDYALLVTNENKMRIAAGVAAGMNPENVALVECERKRDWFIDEYWYCRWLTPFGHTLQECETPYMHDEHPYTFFLYPFIDGEIHSFVHDVIPQQKLINRSTVTQDYIIRAAAKGVLLYPEGAFEGQDLEDVARVWSNPRGLLGYKYKAGVPAPQQISNVTSLPGLMEQLQTQMSIFEDESGVNGALQGKQGYSTTSGTLYAQQTQNSTNSLTDYFDSLSTFFCDSAYKIIKLALQYYDDEMIEQIVGETAQGAIHNALHIRDLDIDVAIIESTTTPAYRAIANDYLIQFWQAGQITAEQLLKFGDFPFADALLQDMLAKQEAQGMPAEKSAGGAQSPGGAQNGVNTPETEAVHGSVPYMTKAETQQMARGGA